MVDLHTHTDCSDGSLSPDELIEKAAASGITTLAITDHDTFEGYESVAGRAAIGLIRGIELNTRFANRSIHLLVYFRGAPASGFAAWLEAMKRGRRERNLRLVEKLRSLGVSIELGEVEALGKSLTGRPHFARVLVEKGYAADRDAAFRDYIGETGRAFVERDSPTIEEAIRLAHESGGVTSLAHPIRLSPRDPEREEKLIAGMKECGLDAIEAFHTDHDAEDIAFYRGVAQRMGLGITGGSDFHGSYKANARLGFAANGTVEIPSVVLEALRARSL